MPQLEELIVYDVLFISIVGYFIIYFFFGHLVYRRVFRIIYIRKRFFRFYLVKFYMFNYNEKLLKYFYVFFNKLHYIFSKNISKAYINTVNLFNFSMLATSVSYFVVSQRDLLKNFIGDLLPFVMLPTCFRSYTLLSSILHCRFFNNLN